MLEKFQTVYPQGRLISELVTIYHGKFIVRTLIQMGGEILASGLAAGNTVEIAEDLARERSLQNLGFARSQSDQGINAVNHEIKQIDKIEQISVFPAVTPISHPAGDNLATKLESLNIISGHSIEESRAESVQPDLLGHEEENEEEQDQIADIDTNIDTDFNADIDASIETDIIETDIDANQNIDLHIDPQFIPPVSNIISRDMSLTQSLPSHEEAAISMVQDSKTMSLNIPPSVTSMQEDQNNDEFGGDAWLYTDYTKKAVEQAKLSEPETTQPLINDELSNELSNDISQILPTYRNTEVPIDLSDVNAKLDSCLDCLAWNKERAREFLQRTYQKDDRSSLSDEELVDFADYLEVLSRVVEDVKRVGWKPNQEKDYYDYNWQQKPLEELTKSELECMYDYLQIFHQVSINIKRLGWSNEDGKRYLSKKYGQQARTRLNYEQLLDFNNYLEMQ